MRIISLKITEDMVVVQPLQDGRPEGTALNAALDLTATPLVNLTAVCNAARQETTAAIVLENPLNYEASDTIMQMGNQRVDVGLLLTDALNIPVLSRTAVNQAGLDAALLRKQNYNCWHLDYYGRALGRANRTQEALLAIGNGFIGLRGAFVESKADGDNYPGTYVAGVYNQLTTPVAGRNVAIEDLVNMPNAQLLSFSVDGGPIFAADVREVQDVYRSLDLRTGQLVTSMCVQMAGGKRIRVRTFKAADMQQWHRYAIRYELTPLNFSGELTVHAGIDGNVVNGNVARYQHFNHHHLQVTDVRAKENMALLTGETRTSRVQFAIGTKLTQTGVSLRDQVESAVRPDGVDQRVRLEIAQGTAYTFEKSVAIYTSLETPTQPLVDMVHRDLTRCSYNVAFSHSADYFRNVWAESDVRIDGDMLSQKRLRVNAYHLFIASHALGAGKIDAALGARGLNGEGGHGHIFWDEMFTLPWLSTHYPRAVRTMLKYRYRRLPAARAAAQNAGKAGALFPWQSGMYGDEQTQPLHLNALTQEWEPEHRQLQCHVSLAVAYNVFYYCHVTGDTQFMAKFGLEILLSVAQYWLSVCEVGADGRYHIRGVMGPDEFHTAYPGREAAGLDDNAYTNIMVTWLFTEVAQLVQEVEPVVVAQLDEQLGLAGADFKQMSVIAHSLNLDIHGGVIGQFAGYFDLQELNLSHYRKQYGDIHRIDHILQQEGRSANSYQVAQKADAVMAFFPLSRRTVSRVVNQLGYDFKPTDLLKNVDYYLDRTTSGSELSRAVYAALCARSGEARLSQRLFTEALAAPFAPGGNSSAEGVHMGVMAALLNVAVQVYGGFDARGAMVTIRPHLPAGWQKLTFKQRVRGVGYTVIVTPGEATVIADHDVTIMLGGKTVDLIAGARQTAATLY